MRLPALTQFLEWWYTREEREQQRESNLEELLKKSDSSFDDHNCFALLDFLSEAGDSDEKAAAKVKLAGVMQSLGEGERARTYLAEARAMKPDGVMEWVTTHGHIWCHGELLVDPISTTQNLIECWQLERSGNLEEFGKRVMQIGTELRGAGTAPSQGGSAAGKSGEPAKRRIEIGSGDQRRGKPVRHWRLRRSNSDFGFDARGNR